MDKIVYIYGSGRDAATRTLRKSALPRQMQVRIGPWIIRPARRTPVEFGQLAKYEAEVLSKVGQGIIQIQNGDTTVFDLDELKSAFAELKGGGQAVDYASMPIAEFYELMRAEKPSQEAWDIFVQRSLTEEDPSFPPLDERLHSLERYSKELQRRGIDITKSEQAFAAAADQLRTKRAGIEQAAREAVEAMEATRLAQMSTPMETMPAPAEPEVVAEIVAEREESPEQMDFTPAETANDSVPEVVAEVADAEAPVTGPAHRAAQLPEGWKTLTNAKIVEMMSGLGIDVPERQNKASLSAAVEKWVEGS